MPLTNTLHAVVIAATWITNHIERPLELDATPPPSGNVWYRTNIVSLRLEILVVGDGIRAQRFTNTVAVATNTTRMRIAEEALPPVPVK